VKLSPTARRPFNRSVIGLLAVAAFVLAGCSSVSTNSDQVGLHYKGGPLSSTVYANCVPNNTRNFDGPSDLHYYYPAGQRTYDFTGGEGAESPPVPVVSKDNQTVNMIGGMTFYLDTTCTDEGDSPGGILRKFHEEIGLKFQPIMDESGTTTNKWIELLRFYMGQPLQKALRAEAQKYGWLALYNDPATRLKIEQEVKRQLPTAVQATTGNNV
jgi:hypothetical protein